GVDLLARAVVEVGDGGGLVAPHDVVDGGRGGRDARRQHLRAQERVHERGLAMVELTDDDQREAILGQLGDAGLLQLATQGLHAALARRRRRVREALEQPRLEPGEIASEAGAGHRASTSPTLPSTSAWVSPPPLPVSAL